MTFKIRFHLKSGKNFLKWQITNNLTGEKSYIDPMEYDLEINEAILHNRKGVAKSIFNGGEKNVCAWILAESFTATPKTDKTPSGTQIKYNPREYIHWYFEGNMTSIDGQKFDKLVTSCRKIYTA